MDNTPMDNLERATLTVMNRKHQFIMRLGEVGRTPGEARKFIDMIDWEKEILWAAMCYDHCDRQAAAEMQAAGAQNQQTASGS